MRIALLGANGGVGEQVLQQALERGHFVHAIVRTPSKISMRHTCLKVIQGDVINDGIDELAEKISGTDAVISALGQGTKLGITSFYSSGVQSLIEALKKADICRFIAISSSGTHVTKDEPWWYLWFVRRLLINVYIDQARMEERIKQSNLDWTIVRPSLLTDGAQTGIYRMRLNHNPKGGVRISRADVAQFMLNQVEDDAYTKQIVALAY